MTMSIVTRTHTDEQGRMIIPELRRDKSGMGDKLARKRAWTE